MNHTQVHHVVAVTCAESGAEAIDLLTRSDYRSFHLILTVRSTYLRSRRGFCFSLSCIFGVSGDACRDSIYVHGHHAHSGFHEFTSLIKNQI